MNRRRFIKGAAVGAAYPPALPSDISGLVQWNKADALVLADGAAVATWPDSSGSGFPFLQATGPSQPIYHSVGIGGLPTVTFDGNAQTMTVTRPVVVPQPFTILAVVEFLTLASAGPRPTQELWDHTAPSRIDIGIQPIGTASRWHMHASTGSTDNGVISPAPNVLIVPYITEAQYAGSGSSHLVSNGQTVIADADTGSLGTDGWLGCQLASKRLALLDTQPNFTNCNISEFAVWNRNLTFSEVRQLRRGLSQKYKIKVIYT